MFNKVFGIIGLICILTLGACDDPATVMKIEHSLSETGSKVTDAGHPIFVDINNDIVEAWAKYEDVEVEVEGIISYTGGSHNGYIDIDFGQRIVIYLPDYTKEELDAMIHTKRRFKGKISQIDIFGFWIDEVTELFLVVE